ncbi:hypothetical protein PCE1_000158 [Barthelona sp. PCE]
MQFNSSFNEVSVPKVCSIPILPLKSRVPGPCPQTSETDILDEVFTTFRANIFLHNFEIQGDADRLLLYLSIKLQQMIAYMADQPNRGEAELNMSMLYKTFRCPGDRNFELPGIISLATTAEEKQRFKQVIEQLLTEMVQRALDKCYNEDGSKNKWWCHFKNFKFIM